MSLYQSASKFRIFNTEILKMNITNFLQLLCQRGGGVQSLVTSRKGGVRGFVTDCDEGGRGGQNSLKNA